MAKERCKLHPFYYEPCSICQQFEQLNKNIKEQQDSIKLMQDKAVELEAEIERANKEIEEMSTDLEQALNSANKSYNPEARLKLSSHDLIVVRGIFVANSFLYNSLANIDQCIMQKKDKVTAEQLMAIKKDLEKHWQHVVDLLKVFAKEFSDSNWQRMIRETQKIVQLAVDTINRRDLGSFTLSKSDDSISAEYRVRPAVERAVKQALNSSGTNNLTAYAKEILIKELTKELEER